DWATTQNNLGIAYRNLPTGDRAENLAKAIACYEAALRVYTEADFPQDWAMTQNNLGIAYSARRLFQDNRANIELTLSCFEAAEPSRKRLTSQSSQCLIACRAVPVVLRRGVLGWRGVSQPIHKTYWSCVQERQESS